MSDTLKPTGTLTLQVPAMPKDANAAGDIFGGWVMAQMDSAAGLCASNVAHCRVVTAAVKEIIFRKPVKIGDTLAIYTDNVQIGNTSIRFRVEAWAIRYLTHELEPVTVSEFVMVALDENGKPTSIKK